MIKLFPFHRSHFFFIRNRINLILRSQRSIDSFLFNGRSNREYHARFSSSAFLVRPWNGSRRASVPSYAPAFPGKLIDHFPRVQHASPVTLENAFKRLFSRRVVSDGRAPAISFGLDYFPRIVPPSCLVSSVRNAPCVLSYIRILEIIVDLYIFFLNILKIIVDVYCVIFFILELLHICFIKIIYVL